MASYLLKKADHSNDIICMEYSIEGYHLNPKMRTDSIITIKDVNIINPDMIENVLEKKFRKNYERLLAIFFAVINDSDATEDGTMIVLDEVARLKSIFLKKYERFLSKEKEKFFKNKLNILEAELKLKLYNMRCQELNEDLSERRTR